MSDDRRAEFVNLRRHSGGALAARLMGMDNALRAALNAGLEEKLDFEAVAGTAGLFNGTNLGNHAQAAGTTFAQYLTQFLYGRVDRSQWLVFLFFLMKRT